MHKLYDIVFTEKKENEELYCIGKGKFVSGNLHVMAGNMVDLLTYFNCFSIKKWREYTTINSLRITGSIEGKATIEVYTIGKSASILDKLDVENDFSICYKPYDIDGEILGIKLFAQGDVVVKNIAYYGSFEKWKDLKIGVSICTYKREEYINVTLKKLNLFSKNNPWLTTLVVDNGSTLDTVETDALKIIHNPNYGGSGGFARALIENIESKRNDYILLMDDDIDLETSALHHMYGLLCGLKDEYKDSFLAGAMLRMQTPYLQHENTAYWGKIRLYSLGNGWDLRKKDNLLNNETISDRDNQYAAWWYCCIPLQRVEKIGLPLPVFIKGDDIEYSLRNDRKVLHMNGIGVWHEAFEGKQTLWVNYFSDRNMLIINHYAKGCGRLTFFVAIIGRLIKRSILLNSKGIVMLNIALDEVINGLYSITSIPADKRLEIIRSCDGSGNCLFAILNILKNAIWCLFSYGRLNKDFLDFREKELVNTTFWKNYLAKSRL